MIPQNEHFDGEAGKPLDFLWHTVSDKPIQILETHLDFGLDVGSGNAAHADIERGDRIEA